MESAVQEAQIEDAPQGESTAPQVDEGATPPKEEAKAKVTRVYRVLAVNEAPLGGEKTYTSVKDYDVSNPETALRKAVKEYGLGTYVAVAESAWHQHTISSKATESLVFT